MKSANIWRISALWIGAFWGALALHIGIGAQLYFKSTHMNDIVFTPMVMLIVAPEIIHPDVNTNSEILEFGVLKQEETSKSELSKVHPAEYQIAEKPQSIVEKSNFKVLKPLEKSSPSKMNREVFMQKRLSTLNVAAKKIIKKTHSFTASKDNNTAAFDGALSKQWLAKVQARLEKQKNYIVGQRISSVQGVVQLEFKVREQGDIFASRIMISSGNQELDWLAMMALKRVEIFPPPPREMVNKTIRVSLIFS
ncbi:MULTISPECIES: energy transducer TonB family protein [unclassified Bartonella]|uniref:energy transducer TonB family protein n=1 Tax=unclassified Bartonella TaxID=2645622 RepID=UPI000999D844|nr:MULTISPECIES: energy transducer TonB [unclassified Bartonella]AQX27683.1 TonB protein [Bartonella sp. JB15]AQX28964.1 protein TonB [Bartonella sp. JB63]